MTAPDRAAELLGLWLAFLNDGDVEALRAGHAPSFVDHDPVPGYPETLEGVISAADEMLRAPGLTVEFRLEDHVASGDRVAYRLAGTGRLVDEGTGALVDLFSLGSVGIFRVAGGRFQERWGAWTYTSLAAPSGPGPDGFPTLEVDHHG